MDQRQGTEANCVLEEPFGKEKTKKQMEHTRRRNDDARRLKERKTKKAIIFHLALFTLFTLFTLFIGAPLDDSHTPPALGGKDEFVVPITAAAPLLRMALD